MSDFKNDCVILRSILLAINACETMETELQTTDPVFSESVRNALYSFKNKLGRVYETNDELAQFDAVFTGCGWDDQGLRWTREHKDDEEDIFIVEFRNKQHTNWRIA